MRILTSLSRTATNRLALFSPDVFHTVLESHLGNGGTATWTSGIHSPIDGRHKARPAESAIHALVKVLFYVFEAEIHDVAQASLQLSGWD